MNSITQPPATDIESLVAEAADRFTDEIKQGRAPSIDEYAEQYPDIAAIIRQVFPALAVLDVGALAGGSGATAGLSSSAVVRGSPDSAHNGLLGDFRILREVGRGGMGVVYEAEQISLGRRIALKVLPFAAMLDRQQLARFKNEARAAATLDHPNIVAIYSVGAERGVHYYAMQLIEGQSLAQVVDSLRAGSSTTPARDKQQGARSDKDCSPPLHGEGFPAPVGRGSPDPAASQIDTAPIAALSTLHAPSASLPAFSSREYFRTIAQLGIQAAEALDHAHQNGILHRDIKPANLLVDDTGKLWITDFGLARIEQDAGMTMTGDLLGTLRYMSPEQALAKRVVVDHRSDIYSLGVTLYELLTLQPAYSATDRQELLRQIAFDEPRRPQRINTRIPRDLETIILKAIEKEAGDRYSTAQEAADDLSRFIADQPIKANPPDLLQRLVKWSRRHRPAVVASIVVLLVVAAASSISTFLVGLYFREAKTQKAIAEQRLIEERKSRADAQANSKRASENLRVAIAAVNDMYTEIAETRLAIMPNVQPLRREILDKALKFYLEFASNQPDASLEFETAKAWRRIGEIHHRFADNVEAEAALLAAVDILDRHPDKPLYRSELASTLWYLSKVMEVTAQRERAEKYCRQGIAIEQKLVWEFPEETRYRAELAKMQHELGHVLIQSDEAIATFTSSNKLYDELLKEDPANAHYARQRAHGSTHLGQLLHVSGNLPEAEGKYLTALELLKAAGDRLDNADVVDSHGAILAQTYRCLGSLLRDAERLPEAERRIRQAIEVYIELVRDFGTPHYQDQLGLCHVELGKTLLVAGRTDDARGSFREAQRTFGSLIKQHPSQADYAKHLVDIELALKKFDSPRATERAETTRRIREQQAE